MKKILPLLVLTGILTLFTSCVYVGPVYHETYDFTFNNNTIWNVYDWYLKDSDGHNHSKNGSKRYNKVEAFSKSTYHDLDKDYYKVIFSYESRPDYFDYYSSRYDVYLNTDTEYRLLQDNFYERSAIPAGEESNNEPAFYLVDSEGNRIEMVKIEK